MADLDEVGARDNWRCWVCDEPVDQHKSVNDARGPSADSWFLSGKAAKPARGGTATGGARERLAHRACNSRKGAVRPVIAWPARLHVADPAVLLTVADRLQRKGGREVLGRCPSAPDAAEAAEWLSGRLARLAPELRGGVTVQPGGGQHLLVFSTG